MTSTPRRVRVALPGHGEASGGDEDRSYDILIGSGLIGMAGELVRERLGTVRAMVVSDETVAGHWADPLLTSLNSAGITASLTTVPPGEASKSFAVFDRVCSAILDARLERGDCVIALGGGVVGDLTGFAAACVRRGMPFVQVPTSLLAQVDSSVGGKTGINAPQGKNLIGAFHQPALVIGDMATLDTLPTREFRAGYAEVVKYGLIDQPQFFEWLEPRHAEIFAGGPSRAEAIAVSCEAKAAIVARDETEKGDRALLNLGHTFGHALEGVARYDGSVLVHGEGVAIGMAMAHRFSVALGLCHGQDAERVSAHLRSVGLPTGLKDLVAMNPVALPVFEGITADALLGFMAQDKKVSRGELTFILTRGIGQAFVQRGVDPATVAQFLADDIVRH